MKIHSWALFIVPFASLCCASDKDTKVFFETSVKNPAILNKFDIPYYQTQQPTQQQTATPPSQQISKNYKK